MALEGWKGLHHQCYEEWSEFSLLWGEIFHSTTAFKTRDCLQPLKIITRGPMVWFKQSLLPLLLVSGPKSLLLVPWRFLLGNGCLLQIGAFAIFTDYYWCKLRLPFLFWSTQAGRGAGRGQNWVTFNTESKLGPSYFDISTQQGPKWLKITAHIGWHDLSQCSGFWRQFYFD